MTVMGQPLSPFALKTKRFSLFLSCCLTVSFDSEQASLSQGILSFPRLLDAHQNTINAIMRIELIHKRLFHHFPHLFPKLIILLTKKLQIFSLKIMHKLVHPVVKVLVGGYSFIISYSE